MLQLPGVPRSAQLSIIAGTMYDKEKFNAVTHLIGPCLHSPALSCWRCLDSNSMKVVSISICGVTLALIYSLSTRYHGLCGRAKNILRQRVRLQAACGGRYRLILIRSFSSKMTEGYAPTRGALVVGLQNCWSGGATPIPILGAGRRLATGAVTADKRENIGAALYNLLNYRAVPSHPSTQRGG